MAFTHIATSENQTSATVTDFSISKPTGTQTGDLLILCLGKDDDPAITPNETWTVIDTTGTTSGADHRSYYAYRIATASEPTTYQFSGDKEEWAGQISCFRPGNSNPAYEQDSGHQFRSGTATPESAALPASPTAANMLLGFTTGSTGHNGSAGSTTSGFTVAGNATSGTGNGDTGGVLAYKLSAAGTETTWQASGVDATAESHVTIAEFSDTSGDPTASGILNAGGSITAVVVASQGTKTITIAASGDDAEEYPTGQITVTSSDLEMGEEDVEGMQWVGLRFPNVAVPAGATITAASIAFQADSEVSSSASPTLEITGETDDSGTWTNQAAGNYGISGRSDTTASVAWTSIPTWAIDEGPNANTTTPDLSTIAQEIVDDAAWASGNAMVFLIDPTTTAVGQRRIAAAFDNTDGNTAPALTISYNTEQPRITSVTPSSFSDGATGIDIAGGGFTSTQGTVSVSQGGGSITREDVTTSVVDTAGTSHTFDYPTTVNADDLLIAIVVGAKNNVTFSGTAFTEILDDTNTGNDVSMYIGTRTAVGNEDGTTFSMTTSGSTMTACAVYRLSGAGAVTVSSAASGTSATPDPPSHTDADADFWIAAVGSSWGAVASAGSSGWSNLTTATNAGENDASVNVVDLVSSTSPQDPGTFTIGWSEVWIAATIGIETGGITQSQTVTSWGDTAIEFTAVADQLADGAATLTVTNDNTLTDTYAVTITSYGFTTSGTLNGGGGVTAVAAKTAPRSSTLNVGGSMSATVNKQAAVDSTLNVGGSVSATVSKQAAVSATLNVGGSLSATTVRTVQVAGTLNVGGSWAATVTPIIVIQVAGTLNVGGGVTASVAGNHAVSPTLNVGGGIASTYTGTHSLAFTMNGGGGATAVVAPTKYVTATLNAGGGVTAVASGPTTTSVVELAFSTLQTPYYLDDVTTWVRGKTSSTDNTWPQWVVDVYEGATLRGSLTNVLISTTTADHEFPWSAGLVSSIGSWDNVRLRIYADYATGGTADIDIMEVWIEAPGKALDVVNATLNGGGSITSTWSGDHATSNTLNVGASITAVPSKQIARTSTLNVGGSIAATVTRASSVDATLNVGGSIAPTTTADHAVTAAISGGGSISATTVAVRPVSATLTVGGGITAAPLHLATVDATANGGGSIASTWTGDHTTDATANVGGSILATVTNSSTGNKQTAGILNAGGSITTTFTSDHTAVGTLNAGGSVTGATGSNKLTSGTLSVGGGITATVSATHIVSGTLSVGGSWSATTSRAITASATLNSGGGITAAFTSTHATSQTLNVGGSIAPTITVTRTTAGSLNVGGSITATTTAATSFTEIAFDPLTDPETTSGHRIWFRYYDPAASGASVNWTLMNGATSIASGTISTSSAIVVETDYTLLGGEAGLITDYTDLSVRLEKATATLRVTDVWFEVPPPPPVVVTLNGGGSITEVVVGHHTTRAFPDLSEGLMGPVSSVGGSIYAVAREWVGGQTDGTLHGGGSITATVVGHHGSSMIQYARPVSENVLYGVWDDVEGGNGNGELWDDIDDVVENDSPYIRARFVGGGDGAIVEFQLSQMIDPGIDTDHWMTYRSENIPMIDLDGLGVTGYVRLFCDGVLVSTQFFGSGGDWTTQSVEIADSLIATVTDYKKLSVLMGLASGANHIGTSFRGISWLEFSAPLETTVRAGGSITAAVLRQLPGQAYGFLNVGGSVTGEVAGTHTTAAELSGGGSIHATGGTWIDFGRPTGDIYAGVTTDGRPAGATDDGRDPGVSDDGTPRGKTDNLEEPGES